MTFMCKSCYTFQSGKALYPAMQIAITNSGGGGGQAWGEEGVFGKGG